MLLRSLQTVAFSVVLLVAVAGSPLPDAQARVPHEPVGEVLEGLPEAPEDGDLRALSAEGAARTSVPVRTPIPFSMVGFEVPDGAALEVRTSTDGQAWDAWTPVDVHPEEGPDPGSAEARAATPGRSFSHPVWVGEATHVQLRVGGGSPADVGVHLIDTEGRSLSLARRAIDAVAAAWRGNPAPAAADVARPSIVTRAQWGANESWRRRDNNLVAPTARALFVHHTVNGNTYTQAQAPGVVQGIYHYHTQSNRWDDIGYNLLVDRFGTVYEGRHGGLERAVIGAHAGGFNSGTVGVAIIGDFSNVAASAAARRSLEAVLAWKADLHHIDPSSQVQMTSAGSTRYASGTAVRLNAISGHRDVSTTACPGRTLYDNLPAIRRAVASTVGPLFVHPEIGPTTLHLDPSGGGIAPVTFKAGLAPAGSWTLRITEGGTLVHSASGTGSTMTATWRPPARGGAYTYALSAPGRRTLQGDITVLTSTVRRIGTAPSPAAASVQISRSTFGPGTAQHAVIARADVFADAMSGGPLAGSNGPLLLTPSAGLDAGVRTELERVLPAGRTVYVLGGTAALSDTVLNALEPRWDVQRIRGGERTSTAAAVARLVRERSGVTTVMVARAGPDGAAPWADALAGGAYGARAGVPVLLTYTDQLTTATRDALRGVTRTDVLGGTAAISNAVMGQMPNARRISGGDRVGTSVQIAERLWGRTAGQQGDSVLIGGGFQGSSWTLALAAAPLAARRDSPLLLSSGSTLSAGARQHLQRLDYATGRVASGRVLGGPSAVHDRVLAELSGLLQ